MSSPQGGFRHTWACVALLLIGIAVAYADSLRGPFVLDDGTSIVTNRSLRSVSTWLTPPGGGVTVQARPVLNLSLALNYWVGGTAVVGYHVTNVVIHALAALLVFGCLRRLLPNPWVAFVGALLWALHPLDTAAVTYVVQRAESLMGLFYLATLYGFLRYAGVGEPAGTTPRSGWPWASVIACALGMGTKEVMVSAPLLVFMVDAVLVTGGPREAWSKRRGYYLALAMTWIIVVGLSVASGGRGGTSGLGARVSPFNYWATQPEAWCHYWGQALWPHPLVFDYGPLWLDGSLGTLQIVLPTCLVVAWIVGTGIGLYQRRPWAVPAAWVVLVLLPTSLIPGARQTMAEQRMYLALVALVWLLGARVSTLPEREWKMGLGFMGAMALVFGGMTALRNLDYASAVTLYKADAEQSHYPNAYAYANEATALLAEHQYGNAERYASEALQMSTSVAAAPVAAGVAALHRGDQKAAESDFRAALRIDPTFASAHGDLATVLAAEGQVKEAVGEAAEAVREDPSDASLKAEYGSMLALSGDFTGAEEQLLKARAMEPEDADAAMNLGLVMDATARPDQASALLDEACVLDPSSAQAAFNLARHQAQRGDRIGAAQYYRAAIDLDFRYASAHENLGNVVLANGDVDGAIQQYRLAERIDGTRPDFHYNLANGFLRRNDRAKAKEELEKALQCDPSFEPAHTLLDRLSAAGL